MADQSIYELFQDCTVRIKTSREKGTGFFVAPGKILTCNHVLEVAKDNEIEIYWKDKKFTAEDIEKIDRVESKERDLALLTISHMEHPCAYLDREADPHDQLYSYGFPDEGGFSISPTCEGKSKHGQFLTIKHESIRHGLSGAPLLNRRTWKVCGIIKSRRKADLILNVLEVVGGQAIPTKVIFDQWIGLESEHDGFHYRDTRWRSLIPRAIGEIIFGRRLFTFLSRVGVRVDPLPFNKDIPQPIALQSPLSLPPLRPDLLGRRVELEDLAFALKREGKEKVAGFWGKPGVGKSMLLKDFAHHKIASEFPDGVVYVPAKRFYMEADLLEEIFYHFNEKIRGIKFDLKKIESTLQLKKILILLDDVRLPLDQILNLREAIPKSAFVFTREDDPSKQGERAFELKGFSEEEVFDLVAQEQAIGRPLTEEEREAFLGKKPWGEFLIGEEDRQAAKSLLDKYEGHPWKIRQAVKLARDQNKPLKDIAETIKKDPSAISITQRRIQSLPEPARRILKQLSVLGVAGAALLISISRSDAADIPNIEQHLSSLIQQDLIQVSDSQYRLTSNISEILSQESDLNELKEKALDYFKGFVEQNQVEPDLVFQDVDAISNILEWAFESGRYTDVIKLGQGLEAALVFNGLWGMWERVLQWELQASQALNDGQSISWALHQLGTRALSLGDSSAARSRLTQALTLRESLGDTDGAAVTRHNLGLLAPLPIVSHLMPPITVGTVAALLLLGFWLIPDPCSRGSTIWRLPILNWLSSYFFPENCLLNEATLKIPAKPKTLEPTPCVIQGTEVFTITQTKDSFKGEISYLLRGNQKRTLVEGNRTKSGWFSMKSVEPQLDECFITFDGEQIQGLPFSRKQGEIVGGVSADEVLIDEKTKKIKTDKSQGASGAFRMLETSPNIWALEIPEGKEFRLRPSTQPSSVSSPVPSRRSSPTPQSPSVPEAGQEPEGNSGSNRVPTVPPAPDPPIESIPDQELRDALNVAVNNKNWSRAIALVDRLLKNASPKEAKDLQEYRVVLEKRLVESFNNPVQTPKN
ncbi:S1 family peptidase [Phormidesmis priestleyi]|uniref:S1 family peptidase n=1 Tax=Phormidesmis priestleyi TaxID=268141 RepID=UPI0009345C06|nr:serine protease [Phormidesmis priestleyi]